MLRLLISDKKLTHLRKELKVGHSGWNLSHIESEETKSPKVESEIDRIKAKLAEKAALYDRLASDNPPAVMGDSTEYLVDFDKARERRLELENGKMICVFSWVL